MDIKRILLIDDDIDLLEQHKVLMESKGFEVLTAERADEGFDLFQSALFYAYNINKSKWQIEFKSLNRCEQNFDDILNFLYSQILEYFTCKMSVLIFFYKKLLAKVLPGSRKS